MPLSEDQFMSWGIEFNSKTSGDGVVFKPFPVIGRWTGSARRRTATRCDLAD